MSTDDESLKPRRKAALSLPQVILQPGLEGEDDNLNDLNALFEELQIASYEAADLALDLLTFVENTAYFAVIYKTAKLPKELSEDADKAKQVERFKEYETRANELYDWQYELDAEEREGHTKYNKIDTAKHDDIPSMDDYLSGKHLDQKLKFTLSPTANEDEELARRPPSSGRPPSLLTNSRWNGERPQELYEGYGTVSPRASLLPPRPPSPRPSTIPPLVPSTSSLGRGNNITNPFNDLFKGHCLGLIYLTETTPHPIEGRTGELSIGVIIHEKYRAQGYAKAAVYQVLEHAFDVLQANRVQALIIDSFFKPKALNLFTQLYFGHEGTRRRSFFSPFEQEWKNVTCLAMLNTDWVMKDYYKVAPQSLWDEMFVRHDRERDELLRWEERRIGLQRSASMETIRDIGDVTQSESEAGKRKGKGKQRQETEDAETSGSEFSEAPLLVEKRKVHGDRMAPLVSYASDADDSDVDVDLLGRYSKSRRLNTYGSPLFPRSPASSTDGYVSAGSSVSVPPSSSEYDMLEDDGSDDTFSFVDDDDDVDEDEDAAI